MKCHFSKRTLWILLSVVAVVLAGAGGYAYYRVRQAQASSTQTSTLQTATVRQGDLVIRASGTGTLIAVTESDLVFGTSGKLENILVKVGSGLGLAIARAIVEKHNGRIWAESKPCLLYTSPSPRD